MSFNSEVKEELVSLRLGESCCALAEISALSLCLASFSIRGRGEVLLNYTSLSPTVAKRPLRLLRFFGHKNIGMSTRRDNRFGGRRFTVLTLSGNDARAMMQRVGVLRFEKGEFKFRNIPQRTVRRICCQRAYIRGMFLGVGNISPPEKAYHAEFTLPDKKRAEFLQRTLYLQNMEFSIYKRRGSYVVYSKNSGEIASLLATMGAVRALLHFEDIRMLSQVKTEVQRSVNCDQANLSRQIATAQKQLEHIDHISKLVGLTALPENLQQLARLRISHPDYSLKQLGTVLEPTKSKASVSRMFKQIEEFANNISEHKPTTSREVKT